MVFELLKVGLIGCGAIGTVLIKAISEGKAGDIKLIGIYDTLPEALTKAKRVVTDLNLKKVIVTSDSTILLENPNIDLIIEAASKKAVKDLGESILMSGKDLVIMSVGALVDFDLFDRLSRVAKKMNKNIYLPSGAICGLDGLKAAATATLKEVTLITRKNPKGLEGAPYVIKNNIKLSEITKPTVLFEGSAEEAIKGFPKNLNVAASLSLAGIGPIETKVKMIADPTINRNVHEIVVKGDFGVLKTRTENVVCPDNPKTSYLASLSAVRTLKKLTEHIQIGT